jgi:hypothetical protein
MFEHLDWGFVVAQLRAAPAGLAESAPGGQNWDGETIVGKYGKKSWATQTPSPRYDVFFENVWPADAAGRILGEFDPPRGLLLDAENVAALYYLEPSLPDREPSETRSWTSRLSRLTELRSGGA